MKKIVRRLLVVVLSCTLISMVSGGVSYAQAPPLENPQSGSIGIEGIVSGGAPTDAPTITFPTNGSTINDSAVTVTGLCRSGYIVKVFKNNVFAGAAVCVGGTYSIQIDLFSGRNILIARMYDDLDQGGPDSNRVTVTFPFSQFVAGNRISLTSSFAKRGAAPGDTLSWPITLSGGVGPYAISIDWGDAKPSQVLSLEFPGQFNATHIYDSAGIYNIIVRAVDKNGEVAFLQLIGVGTGEVAQAFGEDSGDDEESKTLIRILWWPAAIALPMIITAYWLGKRSALSALRKQLGQK